MKALTLFIALMFAFVISNAQQATVYPKQTDGTYAEYSTAFTLTNTTAKYMYFFFTPQYYNAQSYIVHLDSLTGTHTNVAVAVYGRLNSNATWTAIGSAINWKGTTSDTTILFTNATESAYRQFKVLFTGTGTGTTSVSNEAFKIWNGTP